MLTQIYSGILHIVSYFIDGHALLAVTDLSFLPDWGHSGKIGDGLAHYPTDVTRDVLPIRKCLKSAHHLCLAIRLTLSAQLSTRTTTTGDASLCTKPYTMDAQVWRQTFGISVTSYSSVITHLP
jgi:hypothetical protein